MSHRASSQRAADTAVAAALARLPARGGGGPMEVFYVLMYWMYSDVLCGERAPGGERGEGFYDEVTFC